MSFTGFYRIRILCLLNNDILTTFVMVSRGKKNHMDLTKLWWWRQQEKVIGLMSKTTTLHMHHPFLNFLCKYDLKWPNFKFTWELEWISKAINSTIYVWNWVWSPPFISKQNSLLLSNMVKWDNHENGCWRCQIVWSITLPVTHTRCFQDAKRF